MDLGLELLMNPKKKINGDTSSIKSGSGSGGGSVKSIRLADIKYGGSVNSDDVSQITDDDSFIERIEVNEMDDDVRSLPRQRPQSPIKVTSRARSIDESESGEYTEEESASEIGSLGSILAKGDTQGKHSRHASSHPHRMSDEDVLNAKKEILYQFSRLEKKGVKIPKQFTLASNLEDMKHEYDRMKRDKAVDNAIKFQRNAVITLTSGVEFFNSKFDPFDIRLDGWSESVHENIDDYDDVFEELYDKYKGKGSIPPEFKLLGGLVCSGFMFHMTNSMFKNTGFEQVLKHNPELRKQFAAATANTMKAQQPQGSIFSGLGGMFSNLFGGGGGGSPPSAAAPPQQAPQGNPQQASFNMRGPSDIEDIMRDLEKNDNDRIEIMSTVTSSEFTELQDDASISNLVYRKNGKKKPTNGRSVTLDI